MKSVKSGCLLYPLRHSWREGDSSGPVILSTFNSAFHSVTVTTFTNDAHLGGTANMLKETVRIEIILAGWRSGLGGKWDDTM